MATQIRQLAGFRIHVQSRPTLQEFELVPITDPAELEAIDRRRKAAQKAYDAVLRN